MPLPCTTPETKKATSDNDRSTLVNVQISYPYVFAILRFYFFPYYLTSVYYVMCTCYSVYAVYVYRAAHVGYLGKGCVDNINNKHNDDDVAQKLAYRVYPESIDY